MVKNIFIILYRFKINKLDENYTIQNLFGRERKDFRRVSIYEGMTNDNYININEKELLFSCIHQ